MVGGGSVRISTVPATVSLTTAGAYEHGYHTAVCRRGTWLEAPLSGPGL